MTTQKYIVVDAAKVVTEAALAEQIGALRARLALIDARIEALMRDIDDMYATTTRERREASDAKDKGFV